MKILTVSDLHIDIPKNFDFKEFGFLKELKNVDLLLIAGDISGNNKKTYEFLKFLESYIINNKYKTQVCFVCGNHEYYIDSVVNTEGNTVEDIRFLYRKEFYIHNQNSPINFLENDFVQIGDFIITGCTLYSDFKLNNNPFYYEKMAHKYINDFRYIYTTDDKIRKVTTRDYSHWFYLSKDNLNYFCKTFGDKNIIVLTHFCPSGKSINEEYKNSNLNPFYASNLDDFIFKNKNIKLWVHGHTHTECDYTIGNTRIVCKPYGYYTYEHSLSPKDYKGSIIKIGE